MVFTELKIHRSQYYYNGKLWRMQMVRKCLFLLVSFWITWPNVGCAQFNIEGSYEVVDGLNGIFSGYQNMPLRSTRITF